ncbi:MAG: UDP-galactopyranose mutase [Elusimicrobiota bacterium]|jgi:UDP-galactopyranose mutase|nr:UDP-galactopyranose mutase [Elusimicrobiota bacterium]
MKVKNLIVGCGFTGAVLANKIAAQLNEEVLIIDSKEHIAGSSYDYYAQNGICIHKYGSHIFHTSIEKVWTYLSAFADFNTYMHKVVAIIDGIETTIPFNLRSLYAVFPPLLAQKLENKLLEQFKYNSKVSILEFRNQNDADLKFLGEYIYEKVFLNYTTKQWGISPESISESVISRVPVYISCDKRYFQDKYQGIPLCGYTNLVQNILKHPKIKVLLNKKYQDLQGDFQRVFYTGSIDEYFNYKFGQLPYRSLEFKLEEHNCEFYQSNPVVNYPNNYDFTRIHEYKYYLNDKSAKTIIAKEYPKPFEIGKNDRYYPIASQENQALYNKYLDEASKHKNLYFLGRLGDYKYYDIDKAVQRALDFLMR